MTFQIFEVEKADGKQNSYVYHLLSRWFVARLILQP
jgi:hypothetical protein